jgi:hypothetical protein
MKNIPLIPLPIVPGTTSVNPKLKGVYVLKIWGLSIRV